MDLNIAGAKMLIQSQAGTFSLDATGANLVNALDPANGFITADGGLILLPAGTIQLDGTQKLLVPGSVELRGSALAGTTLMQTTPDVDVIQCTGDEPVFAGLTITRSVAVTGPTSPVTGCGVDTNGAHSPYFDKVAITNQRYGLYNSSPSGAGAKYSRDIQYLNGSFLNCRDAGIKLDSPAPGPSDYEANSFMISNGALNTIWGDGIVIGSFTKSNGNNGSFIISVTMSGFSGDGIRASGCVIYIQNVQVHGAQGNGIVLDKVRHAVIDGVIVALAGFTYGSTITFANRDGIRIQNTNPAYPSPCSDIDIVNTLVMQSGGNGVSFLGGKTANVRIQNNTIHSNGMGGFASSNDQAGIKIAGGAVNRLQVVGNRSFNDATAIQDTNYLFSASFGTTPQKYGFYTAAGNPACAGLMITGNDFNDPAFAANIQLNGMPSAPPGRIIANNF